MPPRCCASWLNSMSKSVLRCIGPEKAMTRTWSGLCLAAVLLLAACSQPVHRIPVPAGEQVVFNMHDSVYVNAGVIRLVTGVVERISQVAGVALHLEVIADPSPNAFAYVEDKKETVGITTGMLQLVGHDEGQYGFIVAHEAGHLAKLHGDARRERNTKMSDVSGLLAIALEFAGLPLATVATDTGAHLVALKYDRDQEREADRLSLEYMQAAGFDPNAAITFQQSLLSLSGGTNWAVLSTHPTGRERVDNLRSLIQEMPANKPLKP